MAPEYESFQPQRYERELTALLGELESLDELDTRSIERILRRHPNDGVGLAHPDFIINRRSGVHANAALEDDELDKQTCEAID